MIESREGRANGWKETRRDEIWEGVDLQDRMWATGTGTVDRSNEKTDAAVRGATACQTRSGLQEKRGCNHADMSEGGPSRTMGARGTAKIVAGREKGRKKKEREGER